LAAGLRRATQTDVPQIPILAGIAVFIGGFAFGHWVTNSDPAFLRILAKSERYKLRYDAAKQQVPRVEVV
jgi:type IV secretory pathway TrbD component